VSGIDLLLRRCLQATPEGGSTLTLPPLLQGFPDTAHGGAVLALLDLAGSQWVDSTVPRRVAARIRRSVPLDTPLSITGFPDAPGAALTLERDGHTLVNGTVLPAAAAPDRAWDERSGAPGTGGFELPTSRGCLACGAENPSGLQVRLRFDDEWVWSEYRPREAYRTASGYLAPALFTVLLDEIAWWLGALASGEAGVTTDLRVLLERPGRPFGEPLLALGRRDRVGSTDQKGHFWKTAAGIFAAEGERLASAEIIFAASRAYSRTLIPQLRRINSAESLRRVFPRYVA
jgi:acyl-coenzyme A thioesterase PaaI-like protein